MKHPVASIIAVFNANGELLASLTIQPHDFYMIESALYALDLENCDWIAIAFLEADGTFGDYQTIMSDEDQNYYISEPTGHYASIGVASCSPTHNFMDYF